MEPCTGNFQVPAHWLLLCVKKSKCYRGCKDKADCQVGPCGCCSCHYERGTRHQVLRINAKQSLVTQKELFGMSKTTNRHSFNFIFNLREFISFLNIFYKEVSGIFFLKEDWICRQLAPFREWSEEEFFPEALALNPTYFQGELDVAYLWVCLKILTRYLLIPYHGPQIPRNLKFTCVTKELSIHRCQQKGFQFAVCPYGAEFVQAFAQKL